MTARACYPPCRRFRSVRGHRCASANRYPPCRRFRRHPRLSARWCAGYPPCRRFRRSSARRPQAVIRRVGGLEAEPGQRAGRHRYPPCRRFRRQTPWLGGPAARYPPCRRVFPTHVGVFPNLQSCSAIKMSLPHTCGGASVDPSKKSPLIYSGRIFLQRTCFLSCFFFHILVHLFVKIEKMNCIFRAHTFLFCMSRQSYNNYMVFVVLYFPTSTQRAFIFRQSY